MARRSNSTPPEQNGMDAAGRGSGEEEEEEDGEKETDESGGSNESRGAQENQTEGSGDPKNQNEVPKPAEMYGSYIDPVPVLIVGSHYDRLEGQGAVVEAVRQTQQLVEELRRQFEEYLSISPRLYPLNCLSTVSKEIKELKERLCEVRSELVEVNDFLPSLSLLLLSVFFLFEQLQPRYPRVMEKVARQIESLRAEQTNTKVWIHITRLPYN